MQEAWVRSLGWEDSPGEGNGNPLQYSCLQNSMHRGSWWAIVHGVAKSQTWLSNQLTLNQYFFFPFCIHHGLADCHRLNVCVLPKFLCWCLNPDGDGIWEVIGFEWGHADGTSLWDWSPCKGTNRPNSFFFCHIRKPTRGLLPELVHVGTLILHLLSLQKCAKWMCYLSHSVYGILVVATQADWDSGWGLCSTS